jgi:hypothetical protein
MPSRSSAWRRRALDRAPAAGGAGPGRSGPRSTPWVPGVGAPAAFPPAFRRDRGSARTERSWVTVTVSCWGGWSRTAWHGGSASRVRRVQSARPSFTLQLHSHAVSQRRTGCSGTGRPPACGMSWNGGHRPSGLVGRAGGREDNADGAVRRHLERAAMGTARKAPAASRSHQKTVSDRICGKNRPHTKSNGVDGVFSCRSPCSPAPKPDSWKQKTWRARRRGTIPGDVGNGRGMEARQGARPCCFRSPWPARRRRPRRRASGPSPPAPSRWTRAAWSARRVVTNPGPFDARLAGEWDLWVPGGLWYQSDGRATYRRLTAERIRAN